MYLGRKTLFHFLSQLIVSAAGFAATFAIAREAGAGLLGMYTVAAALIFWLNIPTLAIAEALTKRLSEGGKRGKLLITALGLNGAIASVVGATILFAGSIVDRFIGANVSELISIVFITNVALLTTVAALNGEKQIAVSGVIKAVDRVIRSTIQIVAVIAGAGIAALLTGHAIASGVAAAIGFAILGVRTGLPSAEQARSLVSFARYSWLGTLKIRAFVWMDTIILAFFVSSSVIGIYEVAWNLASLLVLVAISVQTALFPEISELTVDQKYERIHHYINEGLVFTGVFTIPGLFGVLAIGERILRIYSPEFTRGVEVLAILVIARMLAAYGDQFVNVINAVGRPDVAFYINVGFVLLNLILNVILIAIMGWYGAAIATAISAGVMMFAAYGALSLLIGAPSVPAREFLIQVLAASIMAILLLGARQVIPQSHIVTIGLVTAGACVYSALLLAGSSRIRRKFYGLIGGYSG